MTENPAARIGALEEILTERGVVERALSRLLDERGVIDPAAVDARAREIAALPPGHDHRDDHH